MTPPNPDFDLARALMVDGQIRPNRVSDPRIIAAMRLLPRERFVPPALAALAYIDDDLALPGGRALMSPLTLARLLQLAAPRAGERALVVGAGTGYGAAVLATAGVHVTALEEDEALSDLGREACRDAAPSVRFVAGPLREGWAADSPYDFVVIEGAVRAIPEPIGAQVAPNGRLVAVMAPEGRTPYGAIAEHSVGRLRARAVFDAHANLLKSMLAVPAFTLS